MKLHHSVVGPLLLGITKTLASHDGHLSSLVESRSSSLNWAPCDLDLPDDIKNAMREPGDCATLEVPLDYTNKDDDETVELQLIRFNATKEPFKGSVLWNPGGPGISGIETLAYLGPDFRDIIGGHHHIISFDTRGTGKTIPYACFKNATSATLSRRSDSLPQAELWPYVKNQKWKEINALAEACYETQQKYGRFVGTAFTARDMMRIVDALDEDGKLRYWGISYGTILGQIVASMFPDRMAQVLLDSNSLADAYLTSTGIGGPHDAEKSLIHLFTECVELGTETCQLANYSGPATTVQDLRTAVEKLFQKLIDTPELPADSGLSPDDFPLGGNSILQRLKYAILNYLSSPSTYPTVVEILSYALEGEYKKALDLYQEFPSEWNLGTESFQGIACSDSSFRVENADDLYSMYRAHLAESSFGDAIAADYTGCGVWKFDAAEQTNTNDLRNVNTSFPVLVINGAYDPITSLSHAWQVSSRFRGSRMLVHGGVGHGVTSHASNCTLDAIAGYFTDGVLPEVGTVCKPNMLAFEYAQWLKDRT
ncbi:hypothetical protein AK830_g10683 [Neonectria ditissima]|uniref:Peptidase S33 tripeptidyl aminopeptidase-like C-terminal domain-containing protein n=1 Tax=Neonectria ditissima TaxID=78410 RepID=A0A0P7ASX3_9HYPO|nr:hypothetical protein AK830_g10683 [Neonectria ditissima]